MKPQTGSRQNAVRGKTRSRQTPVRGRTRSRQNPVCGNIVHGKTPSATTLFTARPVLGKPLFAAKRVRGKTRLRQNPFAAKNAIPIGCFSLGAWCRGSRISALQRQMRWIVKCMESPGFVWVCVCSCVFGMVGRVIVILLYFPYWRFLFACAFVNLTYAFSLVLAVSGTLS